MNDPRERTVTVDPIDVHVVEWGDGAQPVLLVHGLGGNTVSWEPIGPLLAERLGATVTAPDLPGHGLTRLPAGQHGDFAAHSRVLDALLADAGPGDRRRQLDGRRAVGGARGPLARAGARARAPRPGAAARPGPAPARRRDGPDGAHDVPAARAVRAQHPRPHPRRQPPRRLDAGHHDARPRRASTPRSGSGSSTWPSGGRRSRRRRARSSTRPAACSGTSRGGCRATWRRSPCRRCSCTARHDRLVAVGASRALAERRPDFTLEVIDDCGHTPQLECPEHFVDLVCTWAADVVPAR